MSADERRPPPTFTHVTLGGKMSIATSDNAFLHELELNVRAELTLAETGPAEEEAAGRTDRPVAVRSG
jgi:hypothetical protein